MPLQHVLEGHFVCGRDRLGNNTGTYYSRPALTRPYLMYLLDLTYEIDAGL
ncbi:hypothetical protein [Porphyromonas catoniae]